MEYALKFHMLAARSGWNKPALKATFHQGLNAEVLTKLACQDDEASLGIFTDLAICLNHQLQNRNKHLLPSCLVSQPKTPETMQIDCICLSLAKWERWRQEWRCFYCGAHSHSIISCPTWAQTSPVSQNRLSHFNLSYYKLRSHIQEMFLPYQPGLTPELRPTSLTTPLPSSSCYPYNHSSILYALVLLTVAPSAWELSLTAPHLSNSMSAAKNPFHS